MVQKEFHMSEPITAYNDWLNSPLIDDDTKSELLSIKDDEAEIHDRFYKELDFGTGGLRGIIGAGTNRMNVYTVRRATQGLANVVISEDGHERGVVIAYDSRKMSREFSEEAALCLNANGIKTYCFDGLRPTPELSFAVRKLNCMAGIVITASHNPANYNGYKVYWEDGAQITYPKDKQIIKCVHDIRDYSQVKTMDKKTAIEQGLYFVIDEDIDTLYMNEIHKLALNQNALTKMAKELRLVYTPLHGTGNVPVRRILAEKGFENVFVVKEQELPDGDFPTVPYPNPEDEKAFALALRLADEKNADLVMATDPDADRLGAYCKDGNGEWKALTGNMSGLLLAEYVLSQKEEQGTLHENCVLVTTIVSSNMAKAMSENYGIKYQEVLTGFKYIGEKIKEFELASPAASKKQPQHGDDGANYEYAYGFEESYGCLIGTYARDKDAVGAVAMLCEAAAYYGLKGITLWEQMINIYEKYGYYKEELISVTYDGESGITKINEIMNDLRANCPAKIGTHKILAMRDYDEGMRTDFITNKRNPLDLPKSNVIYLEAAEDFWCCLRPSGTEPKIKLYMGVRGLSIDDSEQKINEFKKEIMPIILNKT